MNFIPIIALSRFVQFQTSVRPEPSPNCPDHAPVMAPSPDLPEMKRAALAKARNEAPPDFTSDEIAKLAARIYRDSRQTSQSAAAGTRKAFEAAPKPVHAAPQEKRRRLAGKTEAAEDAKAAEDATQATTKAAEDAKAKAEAAKAAEDAKAKATEDAKAKEDAAKAGGGEANAAVGVGTAIVPHDGGYVVPEAVRDIILRANSAGDIPLEDRKRIYGAISRRENLMPPDVLARWTSEKNSISNRFKFLQEWVSGGCGWGEITVSESLSTSPIRRRQTRTGG